MNKVIVITVFLFAVFTGKAQLETGSPLRYVCRVVDDQDRPVPGATVDCYHYPTLMYPGRAFRDPEFQQHTVTDANGAFTVDASADTTLVVVSKAGLAPGWKTWPSEEHDSAEPIILTTPTTLSGVVLDEGNRPVADAEVQVSMATVVNKQNWGRNDIFGQLARECFSVRTAMDGRFRIENFPNGVRAALTVVKPGMAQRGTSGHFLGSPDYRSGEQDVKLVLGPAGALEGKVVVQETGQPVANVEVCLLPTTPEGATHGPLRTGTNGSFRFANLQPAKYGVQAIIPGTAPILAIVPDYDTVTVSAGEVTSNIVIHATGGVQVEVSVVSTNDLKPLANVAVSSGLVTAYTDTSGKAVIRMAFGTGYFSASKSDWSPQRTITEISTAPTNHVLIQMVPPERMTGVVRDAAGAPARGVVVSYHSGRYPEAPLYSEAKTDANGRYEMIIRQDSRGASTWGTFSFASFVMARDLQRNMAAVQDFGPAGDDRYQPEMVRTFLPPTNLDLTLQPGITISGSVTDPAGAPITSAEIDLMTLAGHQYTPVEPNPTKVDARGSFSIPALPQGRDYSILNLTAKGYGSPFSSVELRPEKTRTNHYDFGAFVLKKADRVLAGQVLGTDGKPVADVPVRFFGQGQRRDFWDMNNVMSDRDGRFFFSGICEGQVTVSAQVQPFSGDAQAQGGDTNVIVRLGISTVQGRQFLTPPLKTTGIVRDLDGKPASGVMMSLFPVQATTVTSQTDSDGRYEFNWQARLNSESAQWLLARDPNNGLAAILSVNKNMTNVDVVLRTGTTFSTRATEPDGSPVTNVTAQVTLWEGDRGYDVKPQPVVADADGNVRISGLPPGLRYMARVGGPGYTSHMYNLEADETGTNIVNLPPCILTRTDQQVAGQVLDPNGKPAPGIELQVGSTGAGTQRVPTDSNGRFIAFGVSRGAVYISAGLPDVRGVVSQYKGSAGAKGGDTNVVIQLTANDSATLIPQQVTVSGTVFDPSGAPVSGALVAALPSPEPSVQTDANGKFKVQWPWLTQTVRSNAVLFVRDPQHDLAGIGKLDSTATNLDVHLQPGISLSGSVMDSAGRPVTNAVVQLVPFPPENPVWGINRQPSTNASVRGDFTFGALPRGVPYRVRVSADGYGATAISVAAVDTNTNQFELPRVVLNPADQQVTGQVLDMDGKPCWGAQVDVQGDGQPEKRRTHTDSNGNFILAGVCKGPLQVHAGLPAGPTHQYQFADEQSSGGGTNVILRLHLR